MSSQKIGPSSLASRAKFCTGALESSDSMLPTTGLVGGCGIGLSRLVDAIAVVSPAYRPSLRGALATTQSIPFARKDGLLRCARNDDINRTASYAIRSAWR